MEKKGEAIWNRMPKINAELFTLTYGSLVMQLVKDYEETNEINDQLEKMGHNIGVRLIDEFLAKSSTPSCGNFRETAEIIGKVAFKMFLGITCDISNWNNEGTSFSLIFNENPLVDFVELPPQYEDLQYCALLCGVIVGALEMVQLQVECNIVKDTLKGDEYTEIKVDLKEIMKLTLDEYKD